MMIDLRIFHILQVRMESEQGLIYWEKQVYALCGVHCLNTLLQGPFFDEGKLATIALELDAKQKQLMEEEGVTTKEFLMYMAEDSGNVAEDGNYSIQVLEQALRRVGQGLSIISGSTYKDLSEYLKEQAFILHLGSHWYSVRRIKGDFYNLNSLHTMPEVIPDEYLINFFTHYKELGCQVWVVKGSFPPTPQSLYKDMNDNQKLISIQVIHDYTEERMVQNVINWTTPVECYEDGAMPYGTVPQGEKAVDGDAKKAAAGIPVNNNDSKSNAVPKILKNTEKQQSKIESGWSKQQQAAGKIKGKSALPGQPQNKLVLKSNYEKFDIADPVENSEFFQYIRSQIASNLPVQPPSGIVIQFLIDDSKTVTHKFSGFMKVEVLYDYMFVVLTAKPLKKKLSFLLQEAETNIPLSNTNLLIENISDMNQIKLRVREI